MRCETLKRKYRLCPGRAPELVNEERVQEEGENNSTPFGSGGPPSLFNQSPWGFGGNGSLPAPTDDPFRRHGDPFADSFAMFQRMEQLMNGMMRGATPGFQMGPGQEQQRPQPGWPPQQPQEDHRRPPEPPLRGVQVHET